MRLALATSALIVAVFSFGCDVMDPGGEPVEPPVIPSVAEDPEVPVAVPEPEPTVADDSTCCCSYIQQSSMEKAYDTMVARNCTEWGFECVDDGFCDADATTAPSPEPAVAPTPAPVATPTPTPSPSPRPASPSSTTMTRPGTGATRPSSTTRPSSGGMTRPGSASPSPSPSPSPRPSGGMTRPR